MKKLLILSNSSSGLYEFRNELLIDMMKDHEVYISLPDQDHYYDMIGEEGCHMIYTPFERRGMNPLKDLSLLKNYIRIIKRVNPDIIFTYTIKPNIYGGLACRLTKTPYITNITGLGTALQGGGKLAKILIIMYKIAINKAKCVFFQNEFNKSFMQERGVAVNNARILPGSGVNLVQHAYQPYPSEEDGIKILAVLRIMKDKGIEEFFEAVDRLGSDKVKFSLAGEYEEETRELYEPTLNRLVSEGKLDFLGFIDHIDQVYKTHHMIVHPSYHEGLSNVCLEAAACGRMVLASDVPGCRETVYKGSGILFEARSTDAFIDAITEAISLSLDDRMQAGIYGREYVAKTFDRNIVIKRYREAVGS